MEIMKTIYVRLNEETGSGFVVDCFMGADGMVVLQEECSYCGGSTATHLDVRQIEAGEFVPAPTQVEEPYRVDTTQLDA